MEKYKNRKWTLALVLCVAVLVLSLCAGMFAYAADETGATVKEVSIVATDGYEFDGTYWRDTSPQQYYAFTQTMSQKDALARIAGVKVVYDDGTDETIALTTDNYTWTNGTGDNSNDNHAALLHVTATTPNKGVEIDQDLTLNFKKLENYALVISGYDPSGLNLTSGMNIGRDFKSIFEQPLSGHIFIMRTDGSQLTAVSSEYVEADGALTPTAEYLKSLAAGNAETTYQKSLGVKLTSEGIAELSKEGYSQISSLRSATIDNITVTYEPPKSITGISQNSSISRQLARSEFDFSDFDISFRYSGTPIRVSAKDFAAYITVSYYDDDGTLLGTGKDYLTTKATNARFSVALPISNENAKLTYESGEDNWYGISVEQSFIQVPTLSDAELPYADGGVSVTLNNIPKLDGDGNNITVTLDKGTLTGDNTSGYTAKFDKGGIYTLTVTLNENGDYKWADPSGVEGLNRTLYVLTYTITVSGAPVTLDFSHDATEEYGDAPSYSFQATVEGSPSMNFASEHSSRVLTPGDPFKQNATSMEEKPNFRLVYSVVNNNGELNGNKYETPTAVGTYEVYLETAETAWYQGAQSDPVEFEITKRTIPVGAIKASAEFTGKEFQASDVIDLAASGKSLAYDDKIDEVLSLTADKEKMLLVDTYNITLALKTGAGEKGANYVLLDGTAESDSITKAFNIVAASLSFTVYAHKNTFTYGDSIADYLKNASNLTVDKTNLKGFVDVDLAAVEFYKKGETTQLPADSKTWAVGSYVAKYPTMDLKNVTGAAASKEYNLPAVEVEFEIQPKAVTKVTLTKDSATYGGQWNTSYNSQDPNYLWQYGTNLVSTLNHWLTDKANLAPDGAKILTVAVAGTRLSSTTPITTGITIDEDARTITLNQAGEYVVTITLNPNYKWDDGTENNTIYYYGAIYKAYVSALGFSDTDNKTVYNGVNQEVQAQFDLSGVTGKSWHTQFNLTNAETVGDVLNITDIVGADFAAADLKFADFTVNNGAFDVKSAGKYTVTFDIADKYNYEWNDGQTGDTRELIYTVNQAPLTGNWGDDTKSYPYQEGAEYQTTPTFTLDLFADDASKISFTTTLYSDAAYSEAIDGNKITTAGTFYIAVTNFTAKETNDKTYLNYYLPTQGAELTDIRCEFVITPSGLDVVTLVGNSQFVLSKTVRDNDTITFTYFGTAKKFSDFIAGKDAYVNGSKYYIDISVDGATDNDIPMLDVKMNGAAVDKYVITVKPAANYKWNTESGATEEQQVFTFYIVINQLAVDLGWHDTFMTYGDAKANASATVDNKVASDVVNVTVGYKANASDTDTITINSTTPAGKYVVAATALSNSNYTLTGGSNLSTDYFVYKKGIAKPQYNGNASGTYNGSAQTTAALYANSDALWAAQLEATVAGKYPASWFVDDTDKQDVPHTLSATFNVADGKLTYTSAGWYAVTFTIIDSANYCWNNNYETDKAAFSFAGKYTCEWAADEETSQKIVINRATKDAPKLGEYRAMEQRDNNIAAFNELFVSDVFSAQFGNRENLEVLSNKRMDLNEDDTTNLGYYFVLLTLSENKYDYVWTVPFDNDSNDGYIGSEYGNNGKNPSAVFETLYTNDGGSQVRLYYAITASQVSIKYTVNNGGYTFGDNGAGYWNVLTKEFTDNTPLTRGGQMGDSLKDNVLFVLTNPVSEATIATYKFTFTKKAVDGGTDKTLSADELVNDLPWEAGNYEVDIEIIFEKPDVYQTWNGKLTFTVSKLLVQVAWDGNASATYNGGEHTRAVTVTNVAVAKKDADNNYAIPTLDTNNVTDVNYKDGVVAPHTVTINSVSDSNYTIEGLSNNTADFTVNRKVIAVIGKDVLDHVYGEAITENDKQLTVDGIDFVTGTWSDWVEVKLLTSLSGQTDVEATYLTNVGTYRVVPQIKNAQGNYELTVTEGKYTVIKREITITINNGDDGNTRATSQYGNEPVNLNGSAYFTVGGKYLPSGVAASTVFTLFVTDINSKADVKPAINNKSIVGNYPIGVTLLDSANYSITNLNADNKLLDDGSAVVNYVITNADITDVTVTGYTGTYNGVNYEALLSKNAVVQNGKPITWYIGFTGIVGNNDAKKSEAGAKEVELTEYLLTGDNANGLVRNVNQSGWYKVQARADYHNDSEVVLVYVDITKATLTVSVNLSIYFGEFGPENYDGENRRYQMNLADLRNALLAGYSDQTAIDNSVYTVAGLMASDITDFRGTGVIGGSVSYGYAQDVTYARGDKVGSYNLAVNIDGLTSDNYSFADGASVLTVAELPVTVTVNGGRDYTATYGTKPTKLTVEADVAFATEQTSGYAANGIVSIEGLAKPKLASGISTDAYILDGEGKVAGTNNVKYDGEKNVIGYEIVVTLTDNCVLVAGTKHTNTYIIERADNAYTDNDYTLFATNTIGDKNISTNVAANVGALGFAWTYGDYDAAKHALGYDSAGKNALKAFDLIYRDTLFRVTVYRNDTTELGSAEIAASDDLNKAINDLFDKIHKTDKTFNAGNYKVVFEMAQSDNYNGFNDTWYFKVDKQALEITAADMSVIYGNGLDTATVNANALTKNANDYYRFTVEGLVSNGGVADTFEGLGITMAFGSSYQAGYANGSVGTYVISDTSTHVHANYAISQADGKLTVNPREITVEIVNLDNFFNLLLLQQSGGSYSYTYEEVKALQFILKSGSFATGDSEGVIDLSKETLFTKQSVFVLNTEALTAVADGYKTNNAGDYPIYVTAGAHYISKHNAAKNNYVITVNGALTAPENAIGVNAGRFTIKPAQIRSELSQDFEDNTYNGQPKPYNLQTNLPAGVNVDFVANYYKYANDAYTGELTELGTNAPINAGYYRVEFRPVSNPNYVSSSLGQNYSIAKATITVGNIKTTSTKEHSNGNEGGIEGVYFNGGTFTQSETFSGLQNGEKINLSWTVNSSLYDGQKAVENFLTCTPTLGDNSFSFAVRNAGRYSVTISLKDGEETDGKQFLANNYTLSGNATLTLNVLRETLTITSNNTTVEYGSPLSDADRFDGFAPTYTLGHLAGQDANSLLNEEKDKSYLKLNNTAKPLYTTDYTTAASTWGGSYNLSFDTSILDAYNFVVTTANDQGNLTVKARNITVTVNGYPANTLASCTYAGTHNHNECLQTTLGNADNKAKFFAIDYEGIADPSDFAADSLLNELALRIATDRYSAGSTPMLPTESSARFAVKFVNAAGQELSTSNISDNTDKLSYEILPKTLHVVLIQKGGELVTDGTNAVTIPYGTDAATMLAIKFYGWADGEGTPDGELNVTNNNVTVTGYNLNGYAPWTSIAGSKFTIQPVVSKANNNYVIDVTTIITQLTVDSLVLNETVRNVYYKELGTDDAPNYNNGVSGAERHIDISFTYGNGLTLPAGAAEIVYTDTYGLGANKYPTMAGTYSATVTFQPNANGKLNYTFADGASKTFADWQVLKKQISLGWSAPSVILDDGAQTNTVASFVKSIMEIDSFNHGSTSIKDSGIYTAEDTGLTITVSDAGSYALTARFNADAAKNYAWDDGTVGSKVITFTAIFQDASVTLEVEIADVDFGSSVNIVKQKVLNKVGAEVANSIISFAYASVDYVDGMVNGEYRDSVSGLTFNVIPRNAGWYVARAFYAGNGSYGAAQTYYLFQINKATVNKPTMTYTADTYDGTTLSADIGYNTQIVFIREYIGSNGIASSDYVTTSSGATVRALNAGTYTIKLALRDADNYQWATDSGTLDDNAVVLTWNIAKANTNSIIWSQGNVYEVDYGTPFVATATATFTNSIQYTYAPTNGVAIGDAASITDWNSVRPSQHGTYYVRAYCADTNNYPAATDYKLITINKATLFATANGTMTYEDKWADGRFSYVITDANGNVSNITFTEGQLTYVLTDANLNKDALSVGSYDVKLETSGGIVTGLTNANYQVKLTERLGKVVVSPRRINVTIGDAQGYYGETPDMSKVNITVLEQWTAGDVKSVLGLELNPNATAATNVGSYQITATKTNDNYDVTFRNGWYTVRPLNVSVALEQGGGVYGGNIQDVRIAHVYKIEDDGSKTDIGVDALDFTYRYTGTTYGGANVNQASAPTLAGQYIASIVAIKDSDRYNSGNYNLDLNAGEISVPFVIAKKSVDASKLVIENAAYTNSNIKPVVTVPTDAAAQEMFYYSDNGQTKLVFTQDEQVFKTVGPHTFCLTLVDPDNYQWVSVTTAEREMTFRIVKAQNSLVVEGGENKPIIIADWTFGQTANAPAATIKYGDSANIVFEYSTSENGGYTYNVPTNAGTYYVRATMAADDNYEAFTSAPVQFTINKAPLTAPSLTLVAEGEGQNNVYTGKRLLSTVVGYDSLLMRPFYDAEKVTVNAIGNSVTVVATNAGEYTVTFQLADADNYCWASGVSEVVLNWTIARQKVELPTANNNTYIVNGKDLVYTPNGFDSSIMNIEGNVTAYGGNFTATVTLKDTANYEWADDPNRVDVKFTWSVIGINVVFIIIICVVSGACVALAIMAAVQAIRHRGKKRAEARAIDRRSKADGWTGKEPQAEAETATQDEQKQTETDSKEGGNE